MSIYTTEIKNKNKKLSYYEEVFPKLNKFYDENYKTVEVNKVKANKYDCLIKKIKNKLDDIKSSKMDIVTSPIHSKVEKLEMLKRNQIRKEILQELLGE